MFTESQISDKLVNDYKTAMAAKTYSQSNNSSSLDLPAGAKLSAKEGACPLKEAEIDGTKRAWPTFTLLVEHDGYTKQIDGVAVSNLERGQIFVGKPTKDGKNDRAAIADLRPRFGRRASVLTSETGVRFIPETVVLGVVVADGNVYLADKFPEKGSGVKTCTLRAPKNKNYGYIV